MNQEPIKKHHRQRWAVLLVAGLVSWAAYAAVALLSRQFVYGQDHTERPILAVLGLLALAFAWYLAATCAAVRLPETGYLLALIVVGSIAFRLTLLFSWPIQEVDIYRYLWDGAVTTRGVSPFRYSPGQVLDASPDDLLPDDLDRLVALRDSSEAMETILSRVHYGELPTVYPPVSQAVFAVGSLIAPERSSVFTRLVVMKACFVLFDLATLAVVVGLLRLAGQHVGWSIVYGWCPLVIKEIAGSGHLDAVAVFLTCLALLVALRTILLEPSKKLARLLGGTALAAILLGLAVGAKLYPVILVPLLAATWLRRFRWRLTVLPAGVFAAIVSVVLWPMVPRADSTAESGDSVRPAQDGDSDRPGSTDPQNPTAGLKAFLGRWEINDFLFLVMVENLKRPDDVDDPKPWFVVMPESSRVWIAQGVAQRLNVKPSTGAFLLTRFLTGGLFLALALTWAWRAAGSMLPNNGGVGPVSQSATLAPRAGRSADPPQVDWLRAAFLTLAWFWLLSPTQNPWYWCWAMPLVAFARNRAWLLVSGLALIYYLRFWLGYHWPDEPVLGSVYSGKLFFDYVVTWVEFAPWLLVLASVWALGRHERRRADRVDGHSCCVSP